MNPKIKAAWVEALRSGKYTQGVSLLCQITTEDPKKPETLSYCCLGVLAEIQGIQRNKHGDHYSFIFPHIKDRICSSRYTPTQTFFDSIGFPQYITEDNAFLLGGNGLSKLLVEYFQYWNDEVGLTFDQIADLIEFLL